MTLSIYSSWLDITDDEHEPTCEVYEFAGPLEGPAIKTAMVCDKGYYKRGDRPCTCGNKAPIIYQGSHVSPADDHPRGGCVDVAAIPNHCHPSVRGSLTDDGPLVDFLRLSVDEDETTYHGGVPGSATVILTRRHVRELRDTLTAWLDAEVRG